MSRSLVAVLVLLALAGMACGGPTISPSPTAAPSTPAAATPSPAGQERHGDPALEALLPATLGGASLIRESQLGRDLGRQSDALDTMLRNLGKTLDDFSLASAYSSAGDLKAQVGAWRVRGADTARLVPEFVISVQSSSTTKLTVGEISAGGKTVTRIGLPGELTQGPIYAFARDDVVLFVQTTEPDLADAAMRVLK